MLTSSRVVNVAASLAVEFPHKQLNATVESRRSSTAAVLHGHRCILLVDGQLQVST